MSYQKKMLKSVCCAAVSSTITPHTMLSSSWNCSSEVDRLKDIFGRENSCFMKKNDKPIICFPLSFPVIYVERSISLLQCSTDTNFVELNQIIPLQREAKCISSTYPLPSKYPTNLVERNCILVKFLD